MDILKFYWFRVLEWPLAKFDIGLSGAGLLAYKIFATLVILWLIWDMVSRFREGLRRFFRKDTLLDPDDYTPGVAKNREFQEELEAADHLQSTIEPHLKAKNYARVAEIYASLNMSKEAAQYFLKARDKKRAAEHFARLGETAKAAGLLCKAGEHRAAAELYVQMGKPKQAAQAYAQAGEVAKAAKAYVEAGKVKQAAALYADYFDESADPMEAQFKHAQACYQLVADAKDQKKLGAGLGQRLLPALADRFAKMQNFELAGRLYQNAGLMARAADMYTQAGMLEEASFCLRDAGESEGADRALARAHEAQQHWGDAAEAYERGGDFLKAAECYGRANDLAKSAACYERAQDYYRAGVAYARQDRHKDALRVFKQIGEQDPHHDQAALLVGRCYYAMRDFELCAAALENALGSRVTQKNVDYFSILAKAYNQIGQYEKALEIYKKVKTVRVDSAEVDREISSIQTHISKMQQAAPAKPTGALPGVTMVAGPSSALESQQMNVVQNSLGARYEFERELGRGGMGVVYLARDKQLDRPVALKFLGTLVDDSPEFHERFVREARAAAKVNHPNVIAIYDIGADEGKAYIAMEYVEGTNLHKLVRMRGQLPVKQACNFIRQTCDALSVIHDAGIVHRDIKPDNILLTSQGIVKLMDFGLAKSKGSNLTQANQIMGTPCYMAPEQTRGEEADPRTDVYALGLVLHEALTGMTYFAEGNVLRRQQQEMPRPPSVFAEGVPKQLDEIVLKAVAKKREERFQSARELREALMPFCA